MEEKETPQVLEEPLVLTKSEKRKRIFFLLAAQIGFNLFVFVHIANKQNAGEN